MPISSSVLGSLVSGLVTWEVSSFTTNDPLSSLYSTTCWLVDKPVGVISESVVEDSVHLVNPQTNQLVRLRHALRWHQQNAAHHSRKVAQVEDVVAFAWRRQKVRNCFLINLHRRLYHDLRISNQNTQQYHQ